MLRGVVSFGLLVSALSCLVVGCAGEPGEESASEGDAITQAVYTGKILTVTGDALRLRGTPEKETADGKAIKKNIIGLLPVGTTIKVTDAKERNGFYAVEVLTPAMRKKLAKSTGWIYRDFFDQKAKAPVDNTVEQGSGTGSWNNPERAQVDFTFADCSALQDDKGAAMGPSLEQFLAADEPFVTIAIDTNTFSYGMVADIKELNEKSPLNPNGIPIPLRIVKTAATQPDAGFTVTICANPAMKAQLPTDGGKLNLSVYPDPVE
jgi:hypothetical protein